jgi:hypothetical protein
MSNVKIVQHVAKYTVHDQRQDQSRLPRSTSCVADGRHDRPETLERRPASPIDMKKAENTIINGLKGNDEFRRIRGMIRGRTG